MDIISILPQRIRHEEIIKGLKGKIQKLEKLCRALQTERNQLNHKLQVGVANSVIKVGVANLIISTFTLL